MRLRSPGLESRYRLGRPGVSLPQARARCVCVYTRQRSALRNGRRSLAPGEVGGPGQVRPSTQHRLVLPRVKLGCGGVWRVACVSSSIYMDSPV